MKKQKLYCLTAPTGAGKTYLALQNALGEAASGKVCIVAFHTRVLVEQAEELCSNNLKDSSESFKDVKIEILTQTESIPSTKLLDYFIEGQVLILTLHTYLQTLGDLFTHPQIQLFSYVFCEKVSVFIDESHEFFKKCDRTIQLTHGHVEAYGSQYVVESSKNLMRSKHFDTFSVSPPILNLSKIKNAEHLLQFSTPEKINTNDKSCFLFENTQFNN